MNLKEFNADLHFHSPYSGGVSKNMLIPVLAEQAKLKGLQVLATGDILCKEWLKHVKESLVEEKGCFVSEEFGTQFILQTEINDMNNVHQLVFLENFEKVQELREKLEKFGRLDGKGFGRPSLKLNGEQLAEKVVECGGLIGPAHAFTPYFSIYSHYNSLQECFGKMVGEIKFLELGLSADSYFADLIEGNHSMEFLTASDSHCVHPDTLIYLHDGQIVPIKKIHNPQQVISIDFDKDMRMNKSITFKITKKHAPKKMHRINLRTKEITVTPEHRFFVLENEQINEKFASEIEEGDLIATLNKLESGHHSIQLPKAKIDYLYKLEKPALDYLKTKRKERQLMQREVAKKIGVCKDHVWILETGKNKIRGSFLEKYLTLYGIPKQVFIKKFNITREPNIKFPTRTNPKICQILGYLLGDGRTEIGRKGRQIGLYDKDKNLLEFYDKLFKKEFNATRKITKTIDRKSFRVRYHAAILDFIKLISPNLITKSKKRTVPSLIFNLPKKELSAFLRGLFDAEGSVGQHNIDICSSHLFLLKQVQSLLLKFGINSYLYKNLFEKTKKKYRHRLFIYGQENLILFLKNIGFNSRPKQKKLEKYLNSLQERPKDSFVDYLPLMNLVDEIIKISGEKKSVLPKNLSNFFWRKERQVRRRHIKEIVSILEHKVNQNKDMCAIEKLNKLKLFINSDISWQPVQKNENMKPDCEYVYDLTVPGFENYVAEGIIVHNSPWPLRLGREFIRVKMEKGNFSELKKAFGREEGRGISLNVGLDPREGKYHCTGCNNCFAKYSMEEARKLGWKCLKCKGRIKKGVRDRILELADFSEEIHPEKRPPYVHIIPLAEIIKIALNVQSENTQKVQSVWRDFVEAFKSEISVLIDEPVVNLQEVNASVAKKIEAFRNGWVLYKAGAGGDYGKPIICNSKKEMERKKIEMQNELDCASSFKGQKTLGEF